MTEEKEEVAPARSALSIVGVRFKEAGRVFYFEATGFDLEVGQRVVVQTPQGSELAKVVISPDQIIAADVGGDLNPVLRVAGPDDLDQADALQQKIQDELEIARKKVEEHGLPMRIVGGDCTLEGSQLTIYFVAEQRVDFRNLVRDLSSSLGKRVQLLQVGERDRAKLAGGIGHCGYRLCCRAWLTSFPSISIRMAKEQDVPLNPAKISGVCGRLLCCLAFEHEHYRSVRGQLPKVGQVVSTPAGEARLIGVNVPREIAILQMLDTFTTVEMPIDELRKQYGVVVRPVGGEEVEETAAQAEELSVADSGEATGVPDSGKPAEPAAGSSNERARKHRRRRNGRRRKRGKEGTSGE